jgi:8-oxo-dGTP pyrophosphatase MutT (NUDIX family)
MFDDFVIRLAARLQQPLPGEEAQYRMAPSGRARAARLISDIRDYRSSSVLVLCYPNREAMSTVLLKRHDYQGVHSGQVGFPGGKQEPGESLEQTALREAGEEIGLDPGSVRVMGQLTNLYIPVSRFMVQPFVAVAPARPSFVPDPYEVQQVIEADLHKLADKSIITTGMIPRGNGMSIETPYYNVNGFIVWGATAMIISEFTSVLQEAGLP